MDSWGLTPEKDDIVIHAAVMVEDAIDLDKISMDGGKLKDYWQSIVCATHVDFGNPYLKVNPSIFMPPDLDRFLAIRCRAVSALEFHGSNVNGDAFPEAELLKSYKTLLGKGFYIEHASNDPRNAVGIISHVQWRDKGKYVEAVALVDKVKYPDKADQIRRGLQNNKMAGVSIGCVAGKARCSECGNIAQKRHELCRCMDRTNPFCLKGKRVANGRVAHDVCMDLTFYELSYTRAPADRDALPYVVLGAEETPAPQVTPSAAPTIPDEAELTRMVNKEIEQSVKSAIHKLIKGAVDRQLATELREVQMGLRPLIRKLVQGYSLK